jgi:hypothetical protein
MKLLLSLIMGISLSFSSLVLANEDYPEMDPTHANQEQTESMAEQSPADEANERKPSSVKNDEIEGPEYPSFMGF